MPSMARNCLVINLDRCIGCYACEVACKMENDIALGEHWNKMLQRGPFGDYPNMTRYPLPTMCQQCADAPCVHVCPTGASYRDGNNVVLMADAIFGLGAMGYHFGNAIRLADMLPHAPADRLVMGNVDPAGQLRNGTPDSIRAATLQVMEDCSRWPNFVPSTGCDVPPMSSWENIDAFFSAVAAGFLG